MNEKRSRDRKQDEDPPGTGALCPEAQADGVPCTEVGRDCAICERATGRGGPKALKDNG